VDCAAGKWPSWCKNCWTAGRASRRSRGAGGAIRLPSVRPVFDVINRALGNSLDADKEIKLD
jgi:hypothetical protein